MTGDARTPSTAPAADAVAPILRSVLDEIADALAVLTDDGEVRYANAAFRDLVSGPGDGVVGTRLEALARLVPPPELHEGPVSGSESPWVGLVVPTRPATRDPDDRTGRPASLRRLPVDSGRSALLLTVPAGSGHEACRAEVRRAEGAGRLARAAVHELNNVLAAITTFAELLIATRPEADDRDREDLEEIRAAARRGGEVTRTLAAFRVEGPLPAEKVDLGAVLRTHRGLVRRLLPADVELSWELPPSGPRVRIDPRALDRLVVNLALDLGESASPGGALRWRAAPMDPEAAHRLHRGGRDPSPWVVLEIDGADPESAIPAVSASARIAGVRVEGDGGTLRLVLPGEDPTIPFGDRGSPGVGGAPPEPATLLLVEPDASLRAGLRRMLADQGFRVLDAADGTEALALIRAGGLRPEVVLAEVVAPGLAGAEFEGALRTSGCDAPMVFHSGRGDHPRVTALRRSGIAVLDKPVPSARLVQELRSAVDTGRR